VVRRGKKYKYFALWLAVLLFGPPDCCSCIRRSHYKVFFESGTEERRGRREDGAEGRRWNNGLQIIYYFLKGYKYNCYWLICWRCRYLNNIKKS
jgi:hypothetical protein